MTADVRHFLASLGADRLPAPEGAVLHLRPPGFHDALAPSPGFAHLIAYQAGKTAPPPGLAEAVLQHAVSRWHEVVAAGMASYLLEGLAFGGCPGFDTVVVFAPDLHNFMKSKNAALHALTYQCFPCFRYECLSGMTAREAKSLNSRKMVPLVDWARRPEPVLRARFELPTHRSLGRSAGLTKLVGVRPALESLWEGATGFVDLENFAGQFLRIDRAESLTVTLSDGSHEVSADAGRHLVEEFAFRGLERAGTSALGKPDGGVTILDDLVLRLDGRGSASHLADWQIREELRTLNTRLPKFAILERSGTHFIQCHIRADGRVDVEVKLDTDAHYASPQPMTLAAASELFVCFAAGETIDVTGWARPPLP